MNLIEYIGENKLEGLKFENTKTHETKVFLTDNVFVAIGQLPRNEIFKDLLELDKGFIGTNENMETTVPNLFACGDCTGGLLQITKSVYEGTKAGLAVLKNKTLDMAYHNNYSDILKVNVKIVRKYK